MDAKEIARLTREPNVRTFLDLLATTEGAKDGYNTAGGNQPALTSLLAHPNKKWEFQQTNGKKNKSTAAGRYQFLSDTWNDVAPKLGLRDFGPLSQDMAAVELMRRNGSLEKVLAGDFDGAVELAGQTWASLPSSPYPQAKKSKKFVQAEVARLQARGASSAPAPAAFATAKTVATTPGAMAGIVDAISTGTAGAGTALSPLLDTPPPAQTPLQNLIAPAAPAAPAGPASWADQVAAVQRTAAPAGDGMEEEEDESWSEQLMSNALASDNDEARSNAVSKFMGEQPLPKLELPRSIDETINRYLARLAQ